MQLFVQEQDIKKELNLKVTNYWSKMILVSLLDDYLRINKGYFDWVQ